MTELEIAVAPMHRLCKKAGADRVSEAAAKELAKALEEIGVKIAKEALIIPTICRTKEKPMVKANLITKNMPMMPIASFGERSDNHLI